MAKLTATVHSECQYIKRSVELSTTKRIIQQSMCEAIHTLLPQISNNDGPFNGLARDRPGQDVFCSTSVLQQAWVLLETRNIVSILSEEMFVLTTRTSCNRMHLAQKHDQETKCVSEPSCYSPDVHDLIAALAKIRLLGKGLDVRVVFAGSRWITPQANKRIEQATLFLDFCSINNVKSNFQIEMADENFNILDGRLDRALSLTNPLFSFGMGR